MLYLGINKTNNKVLIQKLPAVFTFHKDPNILRQLKRGHQEVQGMMHIFRNDHNSSISPSYIKLAWHYIVGEPEVWTNKHTCTHPAVPTYLLPLDNPLSGLEHRLITHHFLKRIVLCLALKTSTEDWGVCFV